MRRIFANTPAAWLVRGATAVVAGLVLQATTSPAVHVLTSLARGVGPGIQ